MELVLSSDSPAVPSTVVVADAELFPETESGVVVDTDTLFVMVPGVLGDRAELLGALALVLHGSDRFFTPLPEREEAVA